MLYHLEINLENIASNIKNFKNLLGDDIKIMSVVKSNAYGHGALEVSKTVLNNGADFLGVVTIEEAFELRKNKIEASILVLGYVLPGMFEEAIKNDITIPIYSLALAKEAFRVSSACGKKLKCHIKVDTGLHRMGIKAATAFEVIKEIVEMPSLNVEGIFTHLADAENPVSWQTDNQLQKFEELINKLEKNNIKFEYKHVGASAASLLIPSSRFNMVRIGISTYGLWASEETKEAAVEIDYLRNFDLKPVLSFKTKLVEKKHLKAGALIGYGGTYRLRKDSVIGVLPLGYAEGYDRKLSNNSEVLINEKRVKVLGSICMNMIIVDLSSVPDSKIGDEVVLIGNQGNEEITVEDLAKRIETINYEVVTRIPEKVKRVYTGRQKG